MSSVGPIFGAVSALIGVALGAILSGRTQQRLTLSQRYEARRMDREEAYIAVLTAFHRFSRYLRTQSILVEIISRPEDGGQSTPVIRGQGVEDQWQAVDDALSRLHVLTRRGSAVQVAADALRVQLWGLIAARATYGPGAIPRSILQPYRDAEHAFEAAARDDLAET